MKRERRLAHFGEITVRIATPLTFAPGTPPGEIARQLETTVKSLEPFASPLVCHRNGSAASNL